tara:strand:+ start:186 stop:455 length:270 start_codon:yes stop_codon:yes gene_type:complete
MTYWGEMKENKKIIDVKEKQEARNISKTILEFGVTDNQKIDIMLNLAMTLEDNNAMKSIGSFLKNYVTKINNSKNDNKIVSKPNKIIIS